MKDEICFKNDSADGRCGPWTFDAFVESVTRFHGYPAPGVLLGFHMVEAAKRELPGEILYDAICETAWCLPDAVQILTPCTAGNGWLRILHIGHYAVSLFDKFTGEGVRAYLDARTLSRWEDVADWYLKRKPKHEQRSDRIREQIQEHGHRMFTLEPVRVRAEHLIKRSKGPIRVCPVCGEAYPSQHGETCRKCRGDSPYEGRGNPSGKREGGAFPDPVSLNEAVGRRLLHDLTRIVPGESKGPAFVRGQIVGAGDLCQLQQMGRNRLYVEQTQDVPEGWVHEDQVAEAFARAMAGAGTRPEGGPREGKVNISADMDGMLVVDRNRLRRFNLVPEVMAASLKSYSIVRKGDVVAGTRAIPLYLPEEHFRHALALLESGPLFSVKSVRPLPVGVLVTGTEVFQGLVQDRFEAIVTAKVARYGCTVAKTLIVPDDRQAIADAVGELVASGGELVVTTAGLSVDPDDVTRAGLQDAGATDMIFGASVLPGAMTLIARIGRIPVIGVPACALYFQTTSFDVVLPRILAGIPISREDLADLAHGGLCMNCKTCTYPKCPFAK